MQLVREARNQHRETLLQHTELAGGPNKNFSKLLRIQVNATCQPCEDTLSSQPCEPLDMPHDCSQLVQELVPKLNEWSFDVFKLSDSSQGQPLFCMSMALLQSFGLLDGWKLNSRKAANYLLEVERCYLQHNPYHNNTHAADVTQASLIIFRSLAQRCSANMQLEIFALIIAAAVHDLGHPGVNNDFLINTKDETALVYNDKSVNEMSHVSKAFQIAMEEDRNIFEGFTREEYKRVRHLIISMVLSTDMALHFDLLERFSQEIISKPCIQDWKDYSLLLQMVLHLADISNPARPFPLAKRWAELVVTEFLQQGDKEERFGIPVSPMCNRATICMPRSQLNFINVFLKPTMLQMQKLAPEWADHALLQLEDTSANWHQLEAQGVK